MTSLNPSLRLALLQKAKGKKNIFQKGFTLVELMVVIVIVGILSAVALPNFLNQTKKARLTEAHQQIAAGLRTASGLYHEGDLSSSTTCANVGVTNSADWNYTCTGSATGMTIAAAGASTQTTGVNSGNWILTGATGAVTKGTPTGL
jgi:type IV pilus assembly protein PilA